MSSSILSELIVVFDSGLSISASEFIKLVKAHGGKGNYMVTRKTTHVVSCAAEVEKNGYKVRTAKEYGIPIVSEDFITRSIQQARVLEVEGFLLHVAEPVAAPAKSFFSYEDEFVSEVELQKRKELVEKAKENARVRQERTENAVAASSRQPRTDPIGAVMKTTAHKVKNNDNMPFFPEQYELIYYRTLQWTDVKVNHNKYYAIEFHVGEAKGKKYYRLYTHYGRTDDLARNPNAGVKECRFYPTENDAENGFAMIVKEKTGKKGYRIVQLVFSNIGSPALKALGEKLNAQEEEEEQPAEVLPVQELDSKVESLVQALYQSAETALASTMGPVKITAKGIETPLGVITTSQIEKGERVLRELYVMFQTGAMHGERDRVSDLTNEFYTAIPHSLGRGASALKDAVISTAQQFQQKEELLQLMRDMLSVTARVKGLKATEVQMKYAALKNSLKLFPTSDPNYKAIYNNIVESQPENSLERIIVKNIYVVKRDAESEVYKQELHNQRLLFHGSRASNFVGLLSRGVMMPKLVVAMGGKRRDAGLLGNGIYFGDTVTTSSQYTSAITEKNAHTGSNLMLLCNVALGEVKKYRSVAYGLTEPPHGFQSVQGVAKTPMDPSDFKDDEFVVFHTNQQQQAYLLEFITTTDASLASKPLPLISSLNVGQTAVKESSGENSGSMKRGRVNDDYASGASLLKMSRDSSTSAGSKYSSGLLSEAALKLDSGFGDLNSITPKSDLSVSTFDTRPPSSLSSSATDTKPTLNLSTPGDFSRPRNSSFSGYTTQGAGAYSDNSSNSQTGNLKLSTESPLSLSGKLSLSNSSNSVSVDGVRSLSLSAGQFQLSKLREKLGRENVQMKKAEGQLRTLFRDQPASYRLNNPIVHLINVFETAADFKASELSPEEVKHLLFILSTNQIPNRSESAIVESLPAFVSKWDKLTSQVLAGIDWSHVIAVGDSVLGSMLNVSSEHRAEHFGLRDISLRIHSVDSARKATMIAEEIYAAVQTATNAQSRIVRTTEEIIIVGQYPVPHIRISLRRYRSRTEAIITMPIDCTAVGFDGDRVWAIPRSKRAITHHYNLVDVSLRGPDYEALLCAYSLAGFSVALAGHLPHLVDPSKLSAPLQGVEIRESGLAYLLSFENHFITNKPADAVSVDSVWRPKDFLSPVYSLTRYSRTRIATYLAHKNFISPPEWSGGGDELALGQLLFVPWGPEWRRDAVIQEMLYRSHSHEKLGGGHLLVVDYDDVFSVDQVEDLTAETELVPLSVNESWKEVDPVYELNDVDAWYSHALFPAPSKTEFAQTLSNSAAGGKRALLRALLRVNRSVSVDVKDMYTNRSPLFHAVFSGSHDTVKELIEKKFDIEAVDELTGMKLIHAAVFCGSQRIVDAVVRAGASLASLTVKQRWTPLHVACYYGHLATVKYLVNKSDVDIEAVGARGRSALYLAAIGGHLSVVEALIQEHAKTSCSDFAGKAVHLAAAERGHRDVAVLLGLVVNPQLTPAQLPIATSLQTPPRTEAFSPTVSSLSPLLKAIVTEDSGKVVADYYEKMKGTFESSSTLPKEERDTDGNTALHLAAAASTSGSDRHLRLVLDSVAPSLLNSRNNFGETPLHVAVRNLNKVAVITLVQQHRDALTLSTLQNSTGFSSFASFMNKKMYGSDDVDYVPVNVDATNAYGATALDYANHLFSSYSFPNGEVQRDEVGSLPTSSQWETIKLIRRALIATGAKRVHLTATVLPPKESLSHTAYVPEILGKATLSSPTVAALIASRKASAESFSEQNSSQFTFPKSSSSSSAVPAGIVTKKVRLDHGVAPGGGGLGDFGSGSFTMEADLEFSMGSTHVESSYSHSPSKSAYMASPYSSSPSSTFAATESQGFAFKDVSAPQTSLNASSPAIAPPLFPEAAPVDTDRFALPPPESDTPPIATRPARMNRLENISSSFKSETPTDPSTQSPLVRFLTLLHSLRSSLTVPERGALKTLALRGNAVLQGAVAAYNVDHNRVEFLDTLRKISFLAHA